MEITRTDEDIKPRYAVMLSRPDFEALASGAPDGPLRGRAADNTIFILYHSLTDHISPSFEQSSEGDGYFVKIGAPAATLLGEDFEECQRQTDQNLEDAINNSGRIPINSGALTFGYAVMSVEKPSESPEETKE